MGRGGAAQRCPAASRSPVLVGGAAVSRAPASCRVTRPAGVGSRGRCVGRTDVSAGLEWRSVLLTDNVCRRPVASASVALHHWNSLTQSDAV